MPTDRVSKPPRGRARRDTNNAQLLKKRETDRLAQRATRERTKHRIEQLEQEIKRLKSQDQNAVIRDLIETTEKQRRQNEELEGAMFKILLIVKSTCKSIEPSAGFLKLVDELIPCSHQSSPGNDQPTAITKPDPVGINHEVPAAFAAELPDSLEPSNMGSTLPTNTFQEMTSSPLDIYAEHDAMYPQYPQRSLHQIYNTEEQQAFSSQLRDDTDSANLGPSLSTASGRKNLSSSFIIYDQNPIIRQRTPAPDPRLGLSFLPLAADEEKWDVSNDAFLCAMQNTVFMPAPDQVVPDVPFKAIFGGWHTVDASEREKPIWNMLRLIDERVFGMWTSKIQKVALMYVTHALVKFRMNPIPENLEDVPTWLRSRPAQVGVIHPPVIDLLLWPGLRDRLVFEHPAYTKTGEFSAFYCNHLHFYWPFTEQETFTCNKYTKTFQISEKFKEYVFDLRNWTMDGHFLTRYPEFRHDITAYEDRMLSMS